MFRRVYRHSFIPFSVNEEFVENIFKNSSNYNSNSKRNLAKNKDRKIHAISPRRKEGTFVSSRKKKNQPKQLYCYASDEGGITSNGLIYLHRYKNQSIIRELNSV